MSTPPNTSPSTTTTAGSAKAAAVVLSPHYGVALGVVILGMACLALSPLLTWAPLLALVVGLFGLFAL